MHCDRYCLLPLQSPLVWFSLLNSFGIAYIAFHLHNNSIPFHAQLTRWLMLTQSCHHMTSRGHPDSIDFVSPKYDNNNSNWYLIFGNCCLTNDLGNAPLSEAKSRAVVSFLGHLWSHNDFAIGIYFEYTRLHHEMNIYPCLVSIWLFYGVRYHFDVTTQCR